MVVKLQRPILVGGLGLSFSLWILQSWHDSIVQLSEFGLVSALAVGGGLWLFQKNRPQDSLDQLDDIVVDRAMVENAIATTKTVIHQLAIEAENHIALETLQAQAAQLLGELDRQEIKVAVTGGKAVGKSTLIPLLQSSNWAQTPQKLSFWETPALFQQVSDNSDTDILAAIQQSDIVLFLTNGDLTASEYHSLQQLKAAHQPRILIFNKQDQYLADERVNVLLSLKQHTSDDVVATAAAPMAVKVRKHEADGTFQEWMEQPAPDIQQLTQQLTTVLAQQGQQLVWKTTLRQAKLLQTAAKDLLNGTRRDRATPIMEQYQWITAAAAFANPVPALDILATAAINAQMVIDLGNIYQQKFSLEQAQTVAGTMGSLMLKLGLVELSTKAVSTVLKSNAVTFVAGGVVQGVSAAYLTRVAGLSLVEYFEQQEVALDTGNELNLQKLRQTLQTVFQRTQQMNFLPELVQQGVKRFTPQTQPQSVG
jgi:uncharacterized protein